VVELLESFTKKSVCKAFEHNLLAKWQSAAVWKGLSLESTPEMVSTRSEVLDPMFNNILTTRLNAGLVDASVEAVMERARLKNVPIRWWVGPWTEPDDIAECLLEKGFHEERRKLLMGVQLKKLTPVSPPDVRIEYVNAAESLSCWSDVVLEGLDLPPYTYQPWKEMISAVGWQPDGPWHHFIGIREEDALGAVSVFAERGVAVLDQWVVLSGYRKRGIGRAMLVHALLHVRNRGFHIGLLLADPVISDFLTTLGFREFCPVILYEWEAAWY
jgi:GNAT superfamily N-acetyltransferase